MALSELKPAIEKIALRRGTLLVRVSATGGDYFNAGIVADLSVTEEPITQKRDEKGRERQVAGDFAVEAELLQTSTPLSRVKDLASSALDLIVATGPVNGDTLTEAEAEAAGELKFTEQHVGAEADLDYSRGQSTLPIQFAFYADLSTINSIEL